MTDQRATDMIEWRVQFYELEDMPGWYASQMGGPTIWKPTREAAVQAFRDLAQAVSDKHGLFVAISEEVEAEKRTKYRPSEGAA